MVKLDKKVSGSTLVEVLVAMVIIIIIIACFFLSVISIERSFQNGYRTKIYSIFQDNFKQIDSDLLLKSQKIEYNNCTVTRNITKVPGQKGLLRYTVVLSDKIGVILFEGSRYLFESDLN